MKICAIFGDFSTRPRPLDFWYNNIFDSSRGLTGSDLTCAMISSEFVKAGHEVHLFTNHAEPHNKPATWAGVKLYNLDERFSIVDDSFDVMLSLNEPNVFIGMTEKPLRICWQFLNDFNYCAPGYDNYVDKWFGVCDQHTNYLKKLAPRPDKWGTIPLGCSPEWYRDERVPGRVIFTSSNDRGLHLLLNVWPEIKKAVSYANLKIFYHMSYDHMINIEPDNKNEMPLVVEMAQRMRYCKYAIDRIKHLDVEHCGSVSMKQMIKEQNETSVFAFPCSTVAFSEGFSLSTLQALASYTVPVITSQDCLGTVYENSGAVIIPAPVSKNLDEFTNAVIKGLTDKEYADRIIDKCRIFAYKHDWKEIVSKLEREIAKGK
jgi:glycosyltransferase involved in cell wall biosynthesis